LTSAPVSSSARVVRGFLVLAAARVGTQVIGFVAIAIAARRIGPANLGAFQFALSVALYFAIPTNVGLTLVGIREVAREPHRAREVAGEVLTLQALVAAIAFGGLLALTPVLATDSRAEAIMPIAGLTFVVGAFSLEWMLQSAQRLGRLGLARVAGQAVYGALVPVLVVAGLEGAKRLAWLTVLGFVVTAVLCNVWAWRAQGPPKLTLDLRRLGRRLAKSAPIGLAFVMIQVYYSVDSIMLGYLRGTADVGQYAVAYKIPLAVTAISGLWVQALYPHAAALFDRDRDELRRQVGRFATLTIVVALPLGVGATIVGHGLMPALFGRAYRDAGTPFVILMWASVVIAVCVNFANVLLATGDDRPYAIGVTLGAILNVGLNFALIPALGTTGAAINTVAAEALVIAYMVVRFTRTLGPVTIDWAHVARGVAAAGAMAVLLVALPSSLGAVALTAIGAASYGAFAFAFGAVRREDLRALRSARRGA
jgi:O-antigen/teichoic acid export membrane protein